VPDIEPIKIVSYLYSTQLCLLALVLVATSLALADGVPLPNYTPSDLVKQANAPISSMLQLRFQDAYSPSWHGVSGQGNAFGISVTAPLPEFRLIPVAQLSLLRIPVALTVPTQPTGFGDISLVALPVLRASKYFVAGVGPILVFPTATVPTLGQGKWQAGPAASAAWSTREWMIGVLVENPISFAGDANRRAVNQLYVQPFLSVGLGDGWFLRSEPQMIIDWETHEQLIPIDLGFGRVFNIGRQSVSAFIEPGWTVAYDGPAPRYSISFNFVLLYPDFWLRNGSFFNFAK
jgi:hypothetical protein